MKSFSWNVEKNELLASKRDITFEEIVQAIEEGVPVLEKEHPNPAKYPGQKILIVNLHDYAYIIPCVISQNDYFLKTIIPSRKATRRFLRGNHDQKNKHQ